MNNNENAVNDFQIFVKPVGALCNLRCRYCYYLDKHKLHDGDDKPLMKDDLLEKYVIQHIKASSAQTVFFSWHGGEPMMAGLDFYRKAVDFQKKHIPSGRSVLNGIQTNGTMIDWDWAWFLRLEKFIAGISIDGPGELHNHFRKDSDGSSTLSKVLKGYEILQKSGITTEVLCVVSSYNVKFPLVVYNFFREIGAKYITFLPLVEKRTSTAPGVSKASVNPAEFGRFLVSVFDEWIEKDIGNIKIQIFEEAARTAFGQDHSLCIFRENCGGVPVIESNGDFYSCDHYVRKENLVGNIRNKSIEELLYSREQTDFGLLKSQTLPSYCRICDVKAMCNGECPKNRFINTPDGEPGLNYLCEGYKLFFRHCKPFVDSIAEEWRKQE